MDEQAVHGDQAPLIVSLVTMKGGSGKSTVAMSLAGHWSRAGRPVALIDVDPMATVLRWCASGTDFKDVPASGATVEDVAATVAAHRRDGRNPVLIDTPGFRAPVLDAAIACSDIVLIPIRPSPVDFQVAADTAEMVEALTRERSGTQVRFLLTQANRSSVIARHMRSEMLQAGYPLLKAQLTARVIYGEAALAGTTPSFAEPDGAAAREIAELAAELDGLLAVRRQPATRARASFS
jgi:chromosome partitioning protein